MATMREHWHRFEQLLPGGPSETRDRALRTTGIGLLFLIVLVLTLLQFRFSGWVHYEGGR